MVANKKEEVNNEVESSECRYKIPSLKQDFYMDQDGERKGYLKQIEEKCTHKPDGFNGYCKEHSYVVVSTVAKKVKETITQNVKIGSNVKTVTDEIETIKIFNVGETLPIDQFSKQELHDHLMGGNLAIRTSQNEHKMLNKLTRLEDPQIDKILSSHPPHEIELYINRSNFDKDTLERFLFKADVGVVKDIIRKKLGEMKDILL